jgi:hypothetical protein
VNKALFICGSLNQTTMMHQIARQMPEFDTYFSPFYASGFLGDLSRLGLLNSTILGGNHRRRTENYLKDQNLKVDFGGRKRKYDLVVTGTDLIVQDNIRKTRLVLVQEGMTEPEDFTYFLVKNLGAPRFIANTAATGLSKAYDVFCVASPGYRELFIKKGAPADRLIVTGIPNFDNARAYLQNDFPRRNYVLVATSSIRETGKFDPRLHFLQEVKRIAAGRPVIFKLHPNENLERARAEIQFILPEATILADGDANHLVANCDVLITQVSSVVYTGLALGKEVYSYFDLQSLQHLLPIQNNGASAGNIAEVCRRITRVPLAELRQPKSWQRTARKLQAQVHI